jgi:hypothetical protein
VYTPPLYVAVIDVIATEGDTPVVPFVLHVYPDPFCVTRSVVGEVLYVAAGS